MLSMHSPSKDDYFGNRPKRIRHSPSIFSLRSFMSLKRSPTLEQIPISQPTLDNTSREKVRNKVRQSRSMMSINCTTGRSERADEWEKRIVSELLDFSTSHCFEHNVDLFMDTNTTHYKHYNLNKTPALYVLQKLQIHQVLNQCNTDVGTWTVPINDVYIEPLEESEGGYRCALEMPLCGTSLDRMIFDKPQEAVDILLMLIEYLANAEQVLQFEHRNLHAGNILVDRNMSTGEISRVSIINCELGRIKHNSEVIFTPLDHPKFYKPRLPVLNEMRQVVRDPSEFTPITNVLWLSYITRFLYTSAPSSELKKIESILDPKWKLRRRPRSATEVYQQIKR